MQRFLNPLMRSNTLVVCLTNQVESQTHYIKGTIRTTGGGTTQTNITYASRCDISNICIYTLSKKICKYVHTYITTNIFTQNIHMHRKRARAKIHSLMKHCVTKLAKFNDQSLLAGFQWGMIENSWNLCGPFGIAGTFLVRGLKRYGGFGKPLKLSNEKTNSALGGDAAHHFPNPPWNNLALSAFQTHRAS